MVANEKDVQKLHSLDRMAGPIHLGSSHDPFPNHFEANSHTTIQLSPKLLLRLGDIGKHTDRGELPP